MKHFSDAAIPFFRPFYSELTVHQAALIGQAVKHVICRMLGSKKNSTVKQGVSLTDNAVVNRAVFCRDIGQITYEHIRRNRPLRQRDQLGCFASRPRTRQDPPQ